MSFKKFVVAFSVVLCIALVSLEGFGINYDQVKPVVSNYGNAIVVNNGTVPGTIQLMYTVTGNTFTAGNFGSFELDLSILLGTTSATYGTTLTLSQNGSDNLVLSPVPGSFSVTGRTWSDSSTVGISIPASVPSDASLNCDGCTLVGNLNMSAPGSSHLSTPTTIQVKLILAHPSTTQCLKLYNYILDNDTGDVVSSASYTVGGPPTNRKINTTVPGGLLDSVFVYNGCTEDKIIDLQALLDSNFSTNPGPPSEGNAVETYLLSGPMYPDPSNPSSFSITFPTGTAQGQITCLGSFTVPMNQTLLMTIHMKINNITPPASGSLLATFTSGVYGSGSGCSGSYNPLVGPSNPTSVTLSLSQQ